jgi:hypothetical protein
MRSMHSYTKAQREAVSELVRKVIVTEMGMFTPERFRDWTKNLDHQFRKSGLTIRFEVRQRTVYFTIKDVRTGRLAYQFATSTHLPFDDNDVIKPVEEIARVF